MTDLERQFNDHSLLADEKIFLYDLQYAMWRSLGESGVRRSRGIEALVIHGTHIYSGEFNLGHYTYELVGLGESTLIIEVIMSFVDAPRKTGIITARRGDSTLIITEKVNNLIKQMLE